MPVQLLMPSRLSARRLTLGLLLALSLLLAACGGDSAADATGTPVDDAAETAGNASTDAAGETTSAAPAAASGVLRVAMQPIVNTDPLTISSDAEVLVANHVYDYLVDIDPGSNPVPRLATAWTSSADGLT